MIKIDGEGAEHLNENLIKITLIVSLLYINDSQLLL